MLPNFKFGLFTEDDSLRPLIQKIFGQKQEVTVLKDSAAVAAYLGEIEFPKWKILVAGWNCLKNDETLLATLRDIYLRVSTFHLILWVTDEASHPFELFPHSENVHFVEAYSFNADYELEHHLQGIKSILDLQWLYAKASDAVRLYEEIDAQELDHQKKVYVFLEKLIKINEAQSINIYRLDYDAQSFIKELGIGTPIFTSISTKDIEASFDFGETCNTYIIAANHWGGKLGSAQLPEPPSLTCILSTFIVDGDPMFAVYAFDSFSNEILLRSLCNITSRELLHLYRFSQLKSQYKIMKSLTEIDNLGVEKQQVLFKILFYLKSYFGADGIAIVELLRDRNNQIEFEKTYLERARRGTDTFRGTKGFAHHCVMKKKALLITEVVTEGDILYGLGLEFDPEQLKTGHGKKVKIETLRAPQAAEDEQSLMYFPFKYGQKIGAIKISDFTQSNGFTLRQLRALNVFADPIAAMLGNIHSIARLQADIEHMDAQAEMLDVAEVLFFYREITLGIFHQVGNHLDTIDSELLMLNTLASSRNDRTTELNDHMKETKGQIRLAKDLIRKAHQRGLSLNPIEQTCRLIQDIIKPAIDYARKRVERSNIEIKQTLSNEEYKVKLDVELAKESVINILNNAIWAVKSNASTKKELFIAVRKTHHGRSVRVEIEDSGIGIEPANFKKLFTAGFTTRPDGTGLGLYFTRKLIEHFGGTVNVIKSYPGKGTTVELILPLLEVGHE